MELRPPMGTELFLLSAMQLTGQLQLPLGAALSPRCSQQTSAPELSRRYMLQHETLTIVEQ